MKKIKESRVMTIVVISFTFVTYHVFSMRADGFSNYMPKVSGTHEAQLSAVQINETVDGVHEGIVGDGKTDNTAAFQKIFSLPNREVLIPAGHYITGKIDLPENVVVILDPGTIIEDSGHLNPGDKLINIKQNNVVVVGNGAKIISTRSNYIGGEQRHGVYIFSANNVLIENVMSFGHSGDGFYIGGRKGHPASNIVLVGCKAQNNRRQGLSITSANQVDVIDFAATETRGTKPQFGIDLEPNSSVDTLNHISIIRPNTAFNAGGGIQLNVDQLNRDSAPVNVNISEHFSAQEPVDFRNIRPKSDTRVSVTYTKSTAQ